MPVDPGLPDPDQLPSPPFTIRSHFLFPVEDARRLLVREMWQPLGGTPGWGVLCVLDARSRRLATPRLSVEWPDLRWTLFGDWFFVDRLIDWIPPLNEEIPIADFTACWALGGWPDRDWTWLERQANPAFEDVLVDLRFDEVTGVAIYGIE